MSVGEAKADKQSCAQFRDAIIRMETESVRPPGWFALDLHLRALYQQDCIANPTRKPPTEYWYTVDGKPTGVLTSDGQPDGAAYAATPEINERCLSAATEPSLCVMIENLRAACANPVDTQERNQCRFILGENQKPSLPPPGEASGGCWARPRISADFRYPRLALQRLVFPASSIFRNFRYRFSLPDVVSRRRHAPPPCRTGLPPAKDKRMNDA